MAKRNFLFIADEASRPEKGWSNADMVTFHYFNKNGLYAAKKERDAKITDLVEAGKANSGAIWAYGSLNSYTVDRLMDLVNKRKVNSIRMRTILEMLENDIAHADKFIAEKS